VHNIYLSSIAHEKLLGLLDYLESEWSLEVKRTFLEKLLTSFSKISAYPRSCTESKLWPNLFKCVVTVHTSYYYRLKDGEIEIITIIDNRQNPVEIIKEIEKQFTGS
jgi:plasmid stabilization system protein ParE